MKKLLLACMTALGIGASAQTNLAAYTYGISTGNAYTPITGGTKLFPAGTSTAYDNDVSAAITLSSPFTYGGVAVTTCYVSANGFITFGAAPAGTTYTPLSTLESTAGAIAAFAQDGASSTVSGAVPEVRYQDSSTEFVVQWQDHADYYNRTTEKLNFQIHLNYATGAISIIYGNCTDPGTATSSATVQVGLRGNTVAYATNVNNLMAGNIPAGTTCDWSKAVSGYANTSTMLFSAGTNANVKIPAGLQYTWTPGTQLPVRTFAAVSGITNNAATVSWTAPTGATNYNLQYRVIGSCDWINYSGNPLSAATTTLTGLVANTTYQYRVQVVNGSTTSIYSHIPNAAGTGNGYVAAGSFTTLANCASVVTALTSSNITPSSATISWTAPATPPANGYDYYYSTTSTAPTATTTPSGSVPAGTTSANLTGLTPGVKYYYWVRTNCNGVDYGNWSSSANFTAATLCPTVTAPTAGQGNLTTTPTITWTALSYATGYKLSVGTTSGGTDVLNNVDLGNVTSYTFTTPLNSSTKYYYTLTAYTATANGTACTERNFSTACPATTVPYSLNFEDVTTPDLPSCTTAVNAGTGNVWATGTGYGAFTATNKVLKYTYSTTDAANTWFFTRAITLTAGTTYSIKYKYGNASTSFAEKLKVAYGTSATAAGMTNQIADYPNIADAVAHSESLTFTPTVSGDYYFGFQAYSAADKWFLMVDDIVIDTQTLGTSEVAANKASEKVYPNPFTDFVDISDVKGAVSARVADASGRMVASFAKAEGRLDLSNLNSGMYILSVTKKDGTTSSFKIIKK